MKRKLLAVVLAVSMGFSVAGCNSDKRGSSYSEEQEETRKIKATVDERGEMDTPKETQETQETGEQGSRENVKGESETETVLPVTEQASVETIGKNLGIEEFERIMRKLAGVDFEGGKSYLKGAFKDLEDIYGPADGMSISPLRLIYFSYKNGSSEKMPLMLGRELSCIDYHETESELNKIDFFFSFMQYEEADLPNLYEKEYGDTEQIYTSLLFASGEYEYKARRRENQITVDTFETLATAFINAYGNATMFFSDILVVDQEAGNINYRGEDVITTEDVKKIARYYRSLADDISNTQFPDSAMPAFIIRWNTPVGEVYMTISFCKQGQWNMHSQVNISAFPSISGE